MNNKIVVKKCKEFQYTTYRLYLNNVNIGRLFRAGFGGDLEWTLVDNYFDKTAIFTSNKNTVLANPADTTGCHGCSYHCQG